MRSCSTRCDVVVIDRPFDVIVRVPMSQLGDNPDLGRAIERFPALAGLGVNLSIADLPDAPDSGMFGFLAERRTVLEPLGGPTPRVLGGWPTSH